MKTTLTIIANDYTNKIGLLGEHGNCILVRNEYGQILFDTGQGLAINNNLKTMNLNINDLESIAISHGHNDHTGGLIEILKLIKKEKPIPIYGHKEIFNKRYKVFSDGSECEIGSPWNINEIKNFGGKFIQNDSPIEIIKNIILTGPIPRLKKENNSAHHFQYIKNIKIQDPFKDDQALVVKSKNGINIIFGCAHAGIINTINYVCSLFNSDTIYGLFGGTHLLEASDDALMKILREIEKRNVKVLGFNHCTGLKAMQFFENNFTGKYLDASTGSIIEI